jgi:hypothetical protein
LWKEYDGTGESHNIHSTLVLFWLSTECIESRNLKSISFPACCKDKHKADLSERIILLIALLKAMVYKELFLALKVIQLLSNFVPYYPNIGNLKSLLQCQQ